MLEGLPPNRATHIMRLACDEVTARTIADIIVETFDPAETAAAAFEEAPNTQSWAPGPWIVEVYFGTPPDEARVRALVAVTAGEKAAETLAFGRVDERDWIASSLDGLKPVRAGLFVVHGSHDRGASGATEIGIEIEAALAFGTGHHGSTLGCLTLLDRIAKAHRVRKTLDLGTGSGVLAIAAAKRFRRRIMAGDIDHIAVAAARANARLNGVAAFLRPVRAVGAEHEILREGAPYDLVLANILARPLRALAPKIARAAASHADVVLSGLIGPDVPGVLSAYRLQGFAYVSRLEIDGWFSLHLRRTAVRPRDPETRAPNRSARTTTMQLGLSARSHVISNVRARHIRAPES
jgi:ribosomal protein L11 methyltransferase